MCMPLCMCCMCLCMYLYLCVKAGGPMQVSPSVAALFNFWGRFSHWSWSSLVWLGWLGRELSLHSAKITDPSIHVWIFILVLEIWTQVSMLTQQALCRLWAVSPGFVPFLFFMVNNWSTWTIDPLKSRNSCKLGWTSSNISLASLNLLCLY